MSGRIRIATWNMHSGVGIDGRFAPQRIARVIAELGADIVALQEFGSHRAGFDMRAHLEQATGWPALVMATCSDRYGEFGNAVLSRFPILSSVCHALDVGRREPRNAIDVIVDCGVAHLRVIATHLGLRRHERRAQSAYLHDLFTGGEVSPVVLLGDFNMWRTRGGGLQAFSPDSGRGSRGPRTFPAPFPIVALDRILVSPMSARIGLHAHRSRASRVASDHLPLVAEIELG
jgi:endonuclease/exonuclease/phosphatase family metal-dependent hydrolase